MGITAGAFSAAGVAVLFGLLGICAARWQKCVCTCFFGSFSLLLTLIYAVFAAIILCIFFV